MGGLYLYMKSKKAQGGIAGALVVVMVGIIIGAGVTIPVVQEVITNASVTGIAGTILGYLGTLIAVVLLVYVANLIR